MALKQKLEVSGGKKVYYQPNGEFRGGKTECTNRCDAFEGTVHPKIRNAYIPSCL